MGTLGDTESEGPPPPKPASRRILSFDVGIRHLAFCCIEHPIRDRSAAAITLVDWDVIDLERVESVEACSDRLMSALDARFAEARFDVVLVERQPKARSIIMVAVQMLLCGYFSLAKAHGRVQSVRFISATRKLAMAQSQCAGSGSAGNAGGETQSNTASDRRGRRMKRDPKEQRVKYAQNKAYAVATTRHYLEHVLSDFANLSLLEQYPKKDDLCDAFLQAVSFVETGGMCSRLRGV
jgi:hypothetical protein